MEQRVELIRQWKDGESIVCLADSYGVSRKTIYKWIGRYATEGMAGLEDRSRAPHRCPQQLSEETIARVEATESWNWPSNSAGGVSASPLSWPAVSV